MQYFAIRQILSNILRAILCTVLVFYETQVTEITKGHILVFQKKADEIKNFASEYLL